MADDYVANADRGEVLIELDGKKYPMRPSYDSQVAIESRLGVSIDELFTRLGKLGEALAGNGSALGSGLKIFEMAVIVAECIREAGKHLGDADLKAVSVEKVGALLARNRLAAQAPIWQILDNMVTGGADPKKADSTGSSPA